MELVQRVERSIFDRRLLAPGQPVLAAVSGGVDSMVLLHLLAALAPGHGWRLAVAHFNHCLRGRSSDADERLVRRAAEKLGLEFVSERARVRGFAREQGISVEMAARKLRHEFLARAAAQLRLSTIALAHHADDQVELFFLRLLRGAGGEGLAGMKWQNPSPFARGAGLIRPLLDQSKSTLVAFAREHGIAFREDATNTHLDILRNRVRNELIPLLAEKYQPSLQAVILRQMEILSAEGELSAAAARAWLGETPPPSFDDLPVAVQRRGLQIQLLEQGVTPNFELIEHLRLRAGEPVSVSPSALAIRNPAGRVSLSAPIGEVAFDEHRVAVDIKGRKGTLTIDGVRFAWQREPVREGAPLVPRRALNREYFDADKVGSAILLRHWRPGDRFQPIGMGSAVKLQDLFANQKVLRKQRHRLIVGETNSGGLFWVEGLRIGERFKLDGQSRRRLQWRWKRL